MGTENPIRIDASHVVDPGSVPTRDTSHDADFILTLGDVESLTFGAGKEFEDNGAAYQRG